MYRARRQTLPRIRVDKTDVVNKLIGAIPAVATSIALVALRPELVKPTPEPVPAQPPKPTKGLVKIDVSENVTKLLGIYSVPIERWEYVGETPEGDPVVLKQKINLPTAIEVPLDNPVYLVIKKCITLWSPNRGAYYDLYFKGIVVKNGVVTWKKEDLQPPPWVGYLWWKVTLVCYTETAWLEATFDHA